MKFDYMTLSLPSSMFNVLIIILTVLLKAAICVKILQQ